MAADSPVMEFDPYLHANVIESVLRRAIEERRRPPIIVGHPDDLHIVRLEHTDVLGAHFLGTMTWLNQDVVQAHLDD